MNRKRDKQLIVAPFPPPVGGVSSAATNLERMLLSRGFELEVFSTSIGGNREDLYSGKSAGAYVRNLCLMFRYLWLLITVRKIAVYHIFVVSNSAFIRDFGLIVLSKIFLKKVVVHLHSKTEGELFLSEKLLPWLGRGLNFADKVLVLSDKHKEHFGRVIKKHKLSVLENFVFKDDYSGEYNVKSNWLYVGRLTERKGFYDLLDAVDICVNELGLDHFVINCLGLAETEECQQAVERDIKSKSLGHCVKLLGMVGGEDKFDYFKRSRGLIFPSHFENSPVVLKEAMAADLPVLASDISANKEILDRVANAVYFKTGSSESMATVISKVHGDEQLLMLLSTNSKNAFKYDDKYSEKVIEEVLNELGR